MKRILILASNPRHDLDLRREIHILRSVIERSQEGDGFDVKIDSATKPQDLQNLFHKYQPRIVHFCGHGTGEDGLVLEDDSGQAKLVNTSALSNLFRSFSSQVECVLLNACYSEKQAYEISNYINYVIGMNQDIRDDAAILFARGFYQGLAYGKSIADSFELGRNAIEIQINADKKSDQKTSGKTRKLTPINQTASAILPEYLKPILKTKKPLSPFSSEKLSNDENFLLDLPDILHEEIKRKQYREARQEDFGLGKSRVNNSCNLTKREYRQRQVLISKVKSFWIEGVLEKSLQSRITFELKIEESRDAVQHHFRELEELDGNSDRSYDWLQVNDIFEGMGSGRTLLILGDPGTGKTISLLRLAERFIKRSEQDLSLPIPIIFNLSSWADRGKTIAEWLEFELQEKYQVSRSLSKAWIEEEQFLLLLDGLDEVNKIHRDQCVHALNEFVLTHGLTEIVICSRTQEYKTLSERLKLRSAICIQPLTSEYINWYLEDMGEPVKGLREILKKDTELRFFARTPLIFSVMVLTYTGSSYQEISNQFESGSSRHKNLFDNYVNRMILRRRIEGEYDAKRIKPYLSYLSKEMKKTFSSIFLIEKISSKWLETQKPKWLYLWLYSLVPDGRKEPTIKG